MAAPRPNPSKPHSRYKRTHGALLVLPSEGCDLPAPRLPTGRKWTAAERRLWRELWATPQAVMWDDAYAAPVAMYVAHSVAVLAGTASAWQAQEARHLAASLGLTPEGLHRLGWRLAEPGEEPSADVVRLVR